MPVQQLFFPAEKNQILYPFYNKSKQIFIFPDKHDIYVFSLAFACAKFGMKLAIASPANYELDAESISKAKTKVALSTINRVNSPLPAPISNTLSVDLNSQASIIFLCTFLSMRKF